MTGTIAIRFRFLFQNVFDIYSLSEVTFKILSHLNSSFFLLVKWLFGLNKVKLGYGYLITTCAKYCFAVYS